MLEIGLFAKYWEPGRVKTRLAAVLGAAAAARLHRAFLRCILSRLATQGQRRVLAVEPAEHLDEMAAEAGTAWEVESQSSGDLGERMQHYFGRAFARGADRALLLGSDSPTVPVAYLEQAAHALGEVPVVLGPASDGGYYLIGLAGEVPRIFDGPDWGGPEVWQQTIDLLDRAGVAYASLPQWYDVDRPADLVRLHAELAGAGTEDAALGSLRESIDEVFAAGPPAGEIAR